MIKKYTPCQGVVWSQYRLSGTFYVPIIFGVVLFAKVCFFIPIQFIWFSSAMIFLWKTHGMQIQIFINPNGSHCDITLFLLRDFSRSFSGYLSQHIFCSCLLQNASDFWMKFFSTGCNFCSFFWVHQFCWINFRGGVYAVNVEGFFDSYIYTPYGKSCPRVFPKGSV